MNNLTHSPSPQAVFVGPNLDFPLQSNNNRWLVATCLASLAVICLSSRKLRTPASNKQQKTAPVIGFENILLSYISVIQYVFKAKQMLCLGYAKYRSSYFRIPWFDRWVYVASSVGLIEELSEIPEAEMSFIEGAREILQMDYTFGFHVKHEMIDVVRNGLTRNLEALFPGIRDEIICSFTDRISFEDKASVTINSLQFATEAMAQITSRSIVGLPLCKDEGYLKNIIQFPTAVLLSAAIIKTVPSRLRGIFKAVPHPAKIRMERTLAHLIPAIAHRRQEIADGIHDLEDEPKDLVTWFLTDSHHKTESDRDIAHKIMSINFTSIHTTSVSFTHALHWLVSKPELMQPLRDEIDPIVFKHGWSRASVSKMRLLDSFLKESMRLPSLGAFSHVRRAMKDRVMSDGTFIPEGSIVLGVSTPRHYDDSVYPNAEVFDPTRHYDPLDSASVGNSSNSMTNPSIDYLPFGYGPTACPGRFFAATELRAMLAHFVHEYDFEVATTNPDAKHVRPSYTWVLENCIPDPTARFVIRPRNSSSL